MDRTDLAEWLEDAKERAAELAGEARDAGAGFVQDAREAAAELAPGAKEGVARLAAGAKSAGVGLALGVKNLAFGLAASAKLVLGLSMAAVVVLGGLGVATGVLGAPTVHGIDNRFAGVNDTATTIETELHLENPNPIGVNLGGTSIEYAIEMNGIEMVTGTKEGIAIGTGNTSLRLNSTLANERIPDWWVSHLQNGEASTLSVDASVETSVLGRSFSAPDVERTIDTDIASAFDSTETKPIDAEQPVISDPVLYLNETSGTWGSVSDSETPVEMEFTFYNPKPYAIPISEIEYDLAMNDVPVGNGSSEGVGTIPAGGTRTVETTTVIDNERLDDWWVTHVERNEVTDLNITFYATLDLSGAGAGTVPIELTEMHQRIETDMLGSKGDSGGGDEPTNGDETATPTPDDGGTATPTSSDATTPTPTPGGAAPTPTETPTDGGGLL